MIFPICAARCRAGALNQWNVAQAKPASDRSRCARWRQVLFGGAIPRPALRIPSPRPSYTLTRWVFLRLLGWIYLFAFASLWPQIRGLIGSRGIMPAAGYLRALDTNMGPIRYRLAPTLAWFNVSDPFLVGMCVGGTILALLLIIDIWPVPVLALLWLLYLSLVNIGQDFLAFQWDTLLLETGFLAIFFAPGYMLPGRHPTAPPSRTILWLFRWLVFRLMFSSGVVKLRSGDPTWRDLTALAFHYETQPLPNPIAWWMDQLPLGFQKASTAVVLVVELVAPWLIWAPRRVRFVAAGLFIALQTLIFLTGNYTFFNLLSITLCITLLDDAALRPLLPSWLRAWVQAREHAETVPRYRRWVVVPLAFVIVGASSIQLGDTIVPRWNVPQSWRQAARWIEPFYIVNSYGLFAVMTTARPEIIVEGSNDGQTWLPYEFVAKPGDVRRAPPFVAPDQPRLDWQMWFAAVGGPESTSWFPTLMQRLLEGAPDVLGLLAANPFPNAPPRYVRALLYDYRFTDWATLRREGAWWRRLPQGIYFAPIARQP